MTDSNHMVISLQDEKTVQSLFITHSLSWGSSYATRVTVTRKERQDSLLGPPAVCPQCQEGCWDQWWHLSDSKMREESYFFPTSTCFDCSNQMLSKDFGLWELKPKAQSEAQTQVVSLQSVKLFLWLTMPTLMKCYGIGLQNCKYNEWDANSSHWFLFPRHGKPLLITKTVPRLGGEEFLNLSFFSINFQSPS